MHRRRFVGSFLAAVPIVGLFRQKAEAMARLKIVDNLPITIQSGSQLIGPANVPKGSTAVIVHLARCTTATPTFWPDVNTQLQCFVEVSLDNGQHWQPNNGFSAIGGILLARDGSEIPESTMTCPIPAGTDRMRFNVTVTNGPLVSALTTEVQ